ncbi:MAG TPA: hypothetical protein VMT49_01825, partial [Steroidobacteraceae bacterium]|nr:hypothetical protein [Steroidobacteraceae bacterium]
MSATQTLDTPLDTTARAAETALFAPRFYRTDYAAIDRLDITPMQREWDELLQEFRSDGNRNHFERDAAFEAERQALPPALQQEFLDFLVSSVTAEFSGCV